MSAGMAWAAEAPLNTNTAGCPVVPPPPPLLQLPDLGQRLGVGDEEEHAGCQHACQGGLRGRGAGGQGSMLSTDGAARVGRSPAVPPAGGLRGWCVQPVVT